VGNVPGLDDDSTWEFVGAQWKRFVGREGRWGGDFNGPPGEKDITGVNRREQNHFDLGFGQPQP